MSSSDRNKAYWRRNLLYLAVFLAVWFTVSYLCSVVFVERLDTIRVGGARLGFYFAQQESIWVFVVLIFVCAGRRLSGRLGGRRRGSGQFGGAAGLPTV